MTEAGEGGGGSPPKLTETCLVKGKKYDIFVEGGLASVK